MLRKRIGSIVLSAVFALTLIVGGAVHAEESSAAVSELARTTYQIAPVSQNANKFQNLVEGYSVQVPSDMEVTSIIPGIRTVLETSSVRLEIYKEETINSSAAFQTYLGYGNKFLNNTTDHFLDWKTSTTINGNTAHILQWHRDPLARVPGDKNYYTEVDILVSGVGTYTFIFESTYLLGSGQFYYDIVTSMQRQTPTVAKFPIVSNTGERTRNWTTATQRAFEQYFSDSSDLTWGIFYSVNPTGYVSLDSLEKELGYQFPITLMYNDVQEDGTVPYLNNVLANAKNQERLVEVTLQTKEPKNSSSNMVYGILNGYYDQYLRNFASEIRKADIPVLFRLCNEMNGDWCTYSAYHTSKDADMYVELYKYIFNFFEKEGINDKLIWVWNPNEKSFPNYKWNSEFAYYPGDEYVDVIGLTGYNTGNYHTGETWRDFDTIYQGIYNQALQYYNKPLMITEFASSSVGGNKEAWVRDMFEKIKHYPKIKVAIWWSGRDLDAYGNVARPYWMDETTAVVKAFKDNL